MKSLFTDIKKGVVSLLHLTKLIMLPQGTYTLYFHP